MFFQNVVSTKGMVFQWTPHNVYGFSKNCSHKGRVFKKTVPTKGIVFYKTVPRVFNNNPRLVSLPYFMQSIKFNCAGLHFLVPAQVWKTKCLLTLTSDVQHSKSTMYTLHMQGDMVFWWWIPSCCVWEFTCLWNKVRFIITFLAFN